MFYLAIFTASKITCICFMCKTLYIRIYLICKLFTLMVRPEIELCFYQTYFFQTVIPAIPNMKEVARRNTLALQLSSGAHHHHHLAGLDLGAQDGVVQGAHQQTGLLVDQLSGPAAPPLRDTVAIAIQDARQRPPTVPSSLYN